MNRQCVSDMPTQADLPYLRRGGYAYYQGRIVRVDAILFAEEPGARGIAAVEIEELTELHTRSGVKRFVGPRELDYAAAHRVDEETVRNALRGTDVEQWVARVTSGARHTTVWMGWVAIRAAGLSVTEVTEQCATLLRPLWNDAAARVHASTSSVWIDRPGWGWTVPARTPTDAAPFDTEPPGEEFTFTDGYPDAPNCVPSCGNDVFADGFVPVDDNGVAVSPLPGDGWDALLIGCARCGRVVFMGPDTTARRDTTPVLFRADPPPVLTCE